ncbi:MAG: FKBP-type peptidyl-prolyl cis-trans isomerase [Bacteroidia bacterium]|nr:FKBP-type peptidyl-prolyl cis-trans isomerase [Bacteroidia bacterium]
MRLTILTIAIAMIAISGCTGGKKIAPPYEVKAKKGILLDQGVMLYIVTEGKGAKPAVTDELKVNYHGMLEDGTVFDSSFDRGEPNVFPLNRLIKGWQIGLVEVPEGSKVRLVIPPAAAYGDQAKPSIPPGSTLIFDIELISIESKS